MPSRPPHPCTVCGRVAAKGSRCALHPIVRPPRPSFRSRGYGRAWEAVRSALLARDPMCRECRTERSVVAAHIIPKARGGSDELGNLRGLCTRCHNRETASRDGGFGNRKR